MGCGGEDVQLSPKARALVPFSIEAKNQERVNVWDAFKQACSNCGPWKPMVVIKRNHCDTLAVVRWTDLLRLLAAVPGPVDSTETPVQNDHMPATGNQSRLQIAERLRVLADELEGRGGVAGTNTESDR